MNKKSIHILALIFLLLAVVASYPLWSKSLGFLKKESKKSEISFEGFNQDSVDKIIIKQDKNETILQKADSGWKINSLSASSQVIKSFFDDLSAIEIDRLASKNPENHDEYSASEENGYILTLNKDNNPQTFIIGKSGPQANSFYIKLKDASNLYLAKGDLRSKVTQSIADWRDRVLVSISRDQVRKIEVTGPKNFVLVKNKENKWQVESKGKSAEVDESDAKTIDEYFFSLEGYDFAAVAEQKEFANARAKYVFQLKNEKEDILAELTLWQKENDWFGQAKDKKEILKIYSYKITPIFNAFDKLKS